LQEKLERKKYPHDTVQAVLAELETQKFLDDRAFAISFARDRMRRKQLGRDRVALELKIKGIAKELIEETLGPLYGEIDEQTLAREALSKRLHAMKRLPTDSDRRRLADFLRRRGFSYEAIRKSLKADYELC